MFKKIIKKSCTIVGKTLAGSFIPWLTPTYIVWEITWVGGQCVYDGW